MTMLDQDEFFQDSYDPLKAEAAIDDAYKIAEQAGAWQSALDERIDKFADVVYTLNSGEPVGMTEVEDMTEAGAELADLAQANGIPNEEYVGQEHPFSELGTKMAFMDYNVQDKTENILTNLAEGVYGQVRSDLAGGTNPFCL